MTTNSAGVPDQREELSRKSFETIEWLFNSLQNRYLTDAQFKTGVDAVFMACCGLVDGEFTKMVTDMSASISGAAVVEKRHFLRSCGLVTVGHEVGDDHYMVASRVIGAPDSYKLIKRSCASAKAAQEFAEAFCSKLLAASYEEL